MNEGVDSKVLGAGVEMRPSQKTIDEFVITEERWREAVKYFHDNIKSLVKAAGINRDHAVSHRNPPFEVGCAVLSVEPNLGEKEYGVHQAYNFTIKPGPHLGENKRCAERNALDAAQGWAKAVAGIVTVSKEISTGDPQTGSHEALHPCKECRTMMRNLIEKGFLREDTAICNANDSDENNIKIEIRTLKELLDLYQDKE